MNGRRGCDDDDDGGGGGGGGEQMVKRWRRGIERTLRTMKTRKTTKSKSQMGKNNTQMRSENHVNVAVLVVVG